MPKANRAGCGSTRAAHALLDARPLDALALNPLATAAALALAALWSYSCAALLLGELAGSEWRERLGAALSGLNEVGALTALTDLRLLKVKLADTTAGADANNNGKVATQSPAAAAQTDNPR